MACWGGWRIVDACDVEVGRRSRSSVFDREIDPRSTIDKASCTIQHVRTCAGARHDEAEVIQQVVPSPRHGCCWGPSSRSRRCVEPRRICRLCALWGVWAAGWSVVKITSHHILRPGPNDAQKLLGGGCLRAAARTILPNTLSSQSMPWSAKIAQNHSPPLLPPPTRELFEKKKRPSSGALLPPRTYLPFRRPSPGTATGSIVLAAP